MSEQAKPLEFRIRTLPIPEDNDSNLWNDWQWLIEISMRQEGGKTARVYLRQGDTTNKLPEGEEGRAYSHEIDEGAAKEHMLSFARHHMKDANIYTPSQPPTT